MNVSRRRFLQHSALISLGSLALGQVLPSLAQDDAPDGSLPLTGAIRDVHDPVIIKQDDTYYVFSTGTGIAARYSDDLLNWHTLPDVFRSIPEWTSEYVRGATNIWAPDISYFNDKYHLYYSVSTFGSSRSVIGLATNTTLNPDDDAYEWVDEGLVLFSNGGSGYNCIDPNLVIDADGVPWLAFGSFWTGIKLRRLDYATGKPSDEDENLYPLALRTVNSGAIEAACIIRRGDYYYLFASFDFCCRGVDSTYHVRVGRSEDITGTYVDRDGTSMVRGGGTQVTFETERWRGPGHCAILQEDGEEKIVYHAYDADLSGTPTLRIAPLVWDDEGWCSIAEPE